MKIKFWIFNDSGYYFFRLITNENRILVSSEGYLNKADCILAIELFKEKSIHDKSYLKARASNDGLYFFMESSHGELIGVSEIYSRSNEMDKVISLIKEHAKNTDLFFNAN
jgi:Uncharacterized conserved protein